VEWRLIVAGAGLAAAVLASASCSSVCARAPFAPVPPEPAASEPAAPDVEERPELARAFAERGFTGAFALAEGAGPARLVVTDRGWTTTRFIPASTFKIPNSLIALETAVAPDLDFTLPWDGVARRPEWDRDLTMREAFRVSSVPYYQEVARRIGAERMQSWVDRIGYGNRDLGGGIDRFWLDGALRITPLEQLELLRRLHERRLPLAPRTQDLVLELMELDRKDGRVLRAKTGTALREDGGALGWFVGIVDAPEQPGGFACFATVLKGPGVDSDFYAARRAISEELLAALGWW
jgi:beta-lactamase class D